MSEDRDRKALKLRVKAVVSVATAAAAGPLRRARRPSQRLIFSVNNGRSGSDMLQTLFTAFGDVESRHEPEPNFRHLRPMVANRPWLARRWLRDVKLPAIAALGGDTYVETSHVFCKGYLEPMLELGQRFDLIFIERPAREIALSMTKLGAIPDTGPWIRGFYVTPGETNHLPRISAEGLSPYQICYWNALEAEARQRNYRELAKKEGLRTADIRTAELSDVAALTRLFDDLGMDMEKLDRAMLSDLLTRKVNLKLHRKQAAPIDFDRIAFEEEMVESLVGLTPRPDLAATG